MKKLYYTIETYTYHDGRVSGLQYIRMYQIVFNQPKLIGKTKILEIVNGSMTSPVDLEIQLWLDNNGYKDEMFKFIKL